MHFLAYTFFSHCYIIFAVIMQHKQNHIWFKEVPDNFHYSLVPSMNKLINITTNIWNSVHHHLLLVMEHHP